ncbi:MAG: 3-mercaptopyruvate sulfurtransferase [Kordiimonas sp.]
MPLTVDGNNPIEAPSMPPSPLISTHWLQDNLENDRVVPIDASWHMPATGRIGADEFKESLIPGALFFDIDTIVDATSQLPHTMPTEESFEKAIRALGISNDDTIIVYDKGDIPTAARAWWMFRAMGHENVYMLDGGFSKWQQEKRPITNTLSTREPSMFKATFNATLFRDIDAVCTNLKTKQALVIDARSKGRFDGTVPEPRSGLRSGHIPNSINLPFDTLYKADGTLKEIAELKEIIANAPIDLSKQITTSCGSGVTACNLAIAFAALGKWDVAVYDGSWTEWGGNPKLPIQL